MPTIRMPQPRALLIFLMLAAAASLIFLLPEYKHLGLALLEGMVVTVFITLVVRYVKEDKPLGVLGFSVAAGYYLWRALGNLTVFVEQR